MTVQATLPTSRTHAQRVRILVVDDNEGFRESLASLLDGDDLEVIAQASSGAEALELVRTLAPDVVLMDGGIPGVTSAERAGRLAAHAGPGAVLVVSMRSDAAYVSACRRAGVRGVLPADSADAELLAAVHALAAGASFVSPRGAGGGAGEATSDAVALAMLTPRERQIVGLVGEGRTNREMGRRLRLSVNTVETHRKHAMEKLGLHGAADVVRFAVRAGLARA